MKVFAYRNIKSEIMKSSSGGAFIRICQEFEMLHGKGNVAFYGASMLEDMSVRHLGVYGAEQCHIFQGAKYVRSDFSQCIGDIEKDLRAGKWVLVSGTPCQIYGIKKYIQKKQLDSKLFTIDLLCHGTAKNQVWKDYIAWLEKNNKAKLMRFCFRYKPEGWKAYPGYAEFDSHKKLINTPETLVFSKLHLSAYSIEKGCFQCPFASEERNGDITLGDYWGIEYIDTTIRNYKDGVSLILCNSEVARILILRIGEKCRENHDFLIETKSREFIKYQDNFQRPTEMPKQYEEFWKDYEKKEFEDILIKYIGWGRKYKVLYNIKKIARKTMIIELYRRLKRGN